MVSRRRFVPKGDSGYQQIWYLYPIGLSGTTGWAVMAFTEEILYGATLVWQFVTFGGILYGATLVLQLFFAVLMNPYS